MKALRVIQTRTEIAAQIKRSIFSGEIEAGEELTQEIVAEQLESSRMPVREAFQLLESEGVLRKLPNRHIQVVEFSKDNIHQIFSVMADLEQSLWRLQCEQGIAEALVTAIADYMSAQSIRQALFDAEMNIHYTLSESLDNYPLQQTHHRLLNGYFSYALEKCADNEIHKEQLRTFFASASFSQRGIDLQLPLREYYRVLEELSCNINKDLSSENKPKNLESSGDI